MNQKIYLIKTLAPWMMDELIAFSNYVKFTVVLLRKPDLFYKEDIEKLKNSGITVLIQPFSYTGLFTKFKIVIALFLKNIYRFQPGYNSVIAFKSIIWFLRMDLTRFPPNSSIHAQFATQAALIALLIRQYYNDLPEYHLTFHAYDIYFENRWFDLIANESKSIFSISQYNVKYVSEKYKDLNTDKIQLSRLGVFRPKNIQIKKVNKNAVFTLGLLSWFTEKKGIKYLLKAMKMMCEDNKVKLILAGDGPLKEEIIDYINDNDLQNVIEYMGTVKGRKKEEFFKSLDAFVLPAISLPNDQDGIPVVLMEAISYGLPLISTTVSGIPEICINDYNGVLISQRDVAALVTSFNNFIEDHGLRVRFGKKALELSMVYDIEWNSKEKLKYLNWLHE